MGKSTLHHIKHFRRYRNIVRILMKHNLGPLIKRAGLDLLLSREHRQEVSTTGPESDYAMAEGLCQALTELGPTFIKLGQIFSTRTDMFSPPFIENLEKLQDKVEPFSYQAVLQQLLTELGHPDEIFAEFDPEPLAAASIGQVHRGRLKSGEQVIIKIQRPDIEQIIENDLEILAELAALSEWRSEEARRFGIAEILWEYGRILMREIDYDREARNTERMYQNFRNDSRVLIPRVYWQYTTRKILTQDYIEGVKISDLEEINNRGWDRTKISRLGTEAFFTQIMLHGLFQADPHPGNILIIDEEHISFIDFGQVSALSPSRVDHLCRFIVAVQRADLDMAVAALKEMKILTRDVDMDAFQEDLADMMELMTASSIGSLDMRRIRKDLLTFAYRYQMRIPNYLTSLMKALITVEGMGRKLDPLFNFVEVAGPITQKALHSRLSSKHFMAALRRRYYQDWRPLHTLPANINQMLADTNQGRLHMNNQIIFSPSAKKTVVTLANRLSTSLIIAGGLVGSSLIIQSGQGDFSASHTLIGTIGFAISLLAVLVFIISFFRS